MIESYAERVKARELKMLAEESKAELKNDHATELVFDPQAHEWVTKGCKCNADVCARHDTLLGVLE